MDIQTTIEEHGEGKTRARLKLGEAYSPAGAVTQLAQAHLGDLANIADVAKQFWARPGFAEKVSHGLVYADLDNCTPCSCHKSEAYFHTDQKTTRIVSRFP